MVAHVKLTLTMEEHPMKLDNTTVSRITHALETAHEALPEGSHAERHEVMPAMEELDQAVKKAR